MKLVAQYEYKYMHRSEVVFLFESKSEHYSSVTCIYRAESSPEVQTLIVEDVITMRDLKEHYRLVWEVVAAWIL